jgi:hypothetical protein
VKRHFLQSKTTPYIDVALHVERRMKTTMKNHLLVSLSIEREKELKKGNYTAVTEIDRRIEDICETFRGKLQDTTSKVKAIRERDSSCYRIR